jgi:hypothetical protein
MNPSRHEASEREALRRRVKQMYEWFNRGLWDKCFSLIDPMLREQSKTELPVYVERLRAFREVYGSITPWHIRISLHLDASANKRDGRPFAYVYVTWQDDAHGFHMFRERWVKHSERWFTRVVGLVPNQQEPVRAPD